MPRVGTDRPPALGRLAAIACVALVAALLPAVALAHVERPGYWPDPSADRSITPAAGGKVPKPRSLGSALRRKPPGKTLVVCKSYSIKRLKRSIRSARTRGYKNRPLGQRRFLSKREARWLLRVNRKLRKRCKYRHIQPAVSKARNNDRVVVMPGLYLEPKSRAKPTHDKRCAKYRTDGDKPGSEGQALSYEYQYRCPNDQNLVAVMGRTVSSKPDLKPPRENRHDIPNP